MLKSALSAIASPLTDQQLAQLQTTTSDASPQQLAWISGYFWGLSQTSSSDSLTASSPNLSAVASSAPQHKLTIIYASQTGNAKSVADQISQAATAQNLPNQVIAAGDYKGKQFAKETHVIFVASTHGEGEPPDDAVLLHEFLQSKKAPKLANLQYSVLGLGDSSYEFFCQTAKDFDQFLTKLGATPLATRLDADVDYDSVTGQWIASTLETVASQFALPTSDVVNLPLQASVENINAFTKKNPFPATVLTNQKITGRDSDKDIRHLEFDLEGSGLHYQAGDALGVWYQNDPNLVSEILTSLSIDPESVVTVDETPMTIKTALVVHYEITTANPNFVKQFAEFSGSKKLQKLVENSEKLRNFTNNTQILDILTTKKTEMTALAFLPLLRRLTPRLYSIASSQEEVEDEVHLTVGVVSYEHQDSVRFGGASGYLSQRVDEGDEVRVFIEPNTNFTLPADDVPMIMIGPGTGIAPFRGFIQAREQREASGDNWLFFGDRTFAQDFLYQSEWQRYLKSGVLTKMSVAFSRDQAEKVYVQDRLKESAEEVWQWLEKGAHLYVCGDATHMAKDVHCALIDLVQKYGQKTSEQAEAYLTQLRKDKRYQKDVY
jgi:sulfite reductase (NADPH) flavoprotein alpha-component